jgi:hypothetical protein
MFLNYISVIIYIAITYYSRVKTVIIMKKSITSARALLLITIITTIAFATPIYAKKGKKDSVSFTYTVGDYSSWYNIANITECASIVIKDDGVNIYIGVGVWKKPYLAYGELDKDGDHLIDPGAKDKNGDGVIDRYDLGSDGVEINLECLTGDFKVEYKWKVDSEKDGSPKDRRDPEITVPSWDLNLSPGGILDGRIEYFAQIPIPSTCSSFKITTVKAHASPHDPVPSFVIPQVPFGTIGAVVAFFAALGAKTIRKK